MRIVYVANHDSGGNDDEGAISFALERLGHEVVRIKERKGYDARRLKADLCLFHKWDDPEALRGISYPKAFWYFDLVDFPQDPTLTRRCSQRVEWMSRIIPCVDLGFCTDGDWVERWNSALHPSSGLIPDKLVWLPQGADERVTGLYTSDPDSPQSSRILFTGIGKGGGVQRESFIAEMRATYGDRFYHVSRGVHREELGRLIANSSIVVAPDSPVTDRYWSNRVYNALGFGAFLLHPWCGDLSANYRVIPDEWGSDFECEAIAYGSRADLFEKIDKYLEMPTSRRRIASAGYERTIREHLYRHRCEQLVRTVKERLSI